MLKMLPSWLDALNVPMEQGGVNSLEIFPGNF
jgi:hypothetical protein